MAVYSMTGYATAQYNGPADETGREAMPVLGMEIRSVNSRFLDLAFKMSDELRGTEPALRELLGLDESAVDDLAVRGVILQA